MLIIELYEGEKKVAEVPAHDVIRMPPDDYRGFWRIQAMLGRHEEYAVTPDFEGQEGKS